MPLCGGNLGPQQAHVRECKEGIQISISAQLPKRWPRSRQHRQLLRVRPPRAPENTQDFSWKSVSGGWCTSGEVTEATAVAGGAGGPAVRYPVRERGTPRQGALRTLPVGIDFPETAPWLHPGAGQRSRLLSPSPTILHGTFSLLQGLSPLFRGWGFSPHQAHILLEAGTEGAAGPQLPRALSRGLRGTQ